MGPIYSGRSIISSGTELTEVLSEAGEQLLRKAVRETARERGEALRQEHIEAGLPINLESLMKNYDSPVEEAFEWAEGEVMTPTRWHADCTYCPFYDVWGKVGGQKLGWLFDEELHPALYQAYHPGIQVKFVSNKNRGDHVLRVPLRHRGRHGASGGDLRSRGMTSRPQRTWRVPLRRGIYRRPPPRRSPLKKFGFIPA